MGEARASRLRPRLRPAKSPAPETAAAAGAAVGAPAADADAPVAIAVEPADQPEVHALLRQSDAYHATLYPAESNHLIDVAALSEPNVRFVVARRGGAAVGCGALMLGADGEAELKRMFVAPEARGRKIGSRILDALEAAGKAEAVRVIRLETGVRQPESLALYRRRGYTERGPVRGVSARPAEPLFREVDRVTPPVFPAARSASRDLATHRGVAARSRIFAAANSGMTGGRQYR